MVSKKESLKGIKQTTKVDKLKKPFGFCCDEKSPDFSTRYNQRTPPFVSSLTGVVLNGGGPDLKLRIKDIFTKSVPKSGTHRAYLKSTTANLGGCRWCRGPINWYLEDEISVGQEIFAKNKQDQYNEDGQKNVISGRKKILKRRKHKKGNPLSKKTQTQA